MTTPATGPAAGPLTGPFLLASFAWSWAFWWPAALLGAGALAAPTVALQTLGAVGPTLAGVWVLRRAFGRGAAGRVLRRAPGALRPGPLLVAALAAPGLTLLAAALEFAWGAATGHPWVLPPDAPLRVLSGRLGWPALVALVPVWVLAQLPSSPLLEEFGWRGVLLPRLQRRLNALASALVLGAVWGVWHLPLLLAQGQGPAVGPFLVLIAAHTVIGTALFNATRGAMAVALVYHASLNVALTVFAFGRPSAALVGVTVLAALGAVLAFGPRDLAREPRRVALWDDAAGFADAQRSTQASA